MKLLLLTPEVFLPANSGGRLRVAAEIDYLSQRHELSVIALAFNPVGSAQLQAMQAMCHRLLVVNMPQRSGLPASQESLPWPLQPYYDEGVIQAIRQLQPETFDAALIEFLFMAPYSRYLSIPTILCEHNIESSIRRQFAAHFTDERRRVFELGTSTLMSRYEDKVWPMFPIRTTVSALDKQEMDRRCQLGRSLVVPNGVDLRGGTLRLSAETPRVLYMGTFGYEPNLDAAHYLASSIMPKVWERQPEVELWLAGKSPTQSLLNLQIEPRITVVSQPPDMRAVASRCSLLAVPLRLGGGTRLKVLEGLAWGLPVVSTTLGCEGIEVVPGTHLLTADTPEALAASILDVLGSDVLATRLAQNGRALVEARYGWDRCFEPLQAALLSLQAPAIEAGFQFPQQT